MKTLIKTAVAAGVLAMSSIAQGAILPVNIFTPDGSTQIVNNITDIDYNSNGAAVVIGGGPFGAGGLAVGTVLTNLFQTNVTGFNRGAASVGSSEILAGLNDSFAAGGYEITAVATLTEVVVASSPNTATFAVLGGTVALYYDSTASGGSQSNLSAGTGFDDGELIYQGTIVAGTSGFVVIGNTGLGSTNVLSSTTFVDTDAIQNLPSNLLTFFLNAEGQTAYPAGNANTNNYHIGGSATFPNYTVDVCQAGDGLGDCDLKLRFDGSSRFIPEPGSLALLGVAALALGAAGRRKSRK